VRYADIFIREGDASMTLANEARPAAGSADFDRTPPQSIEAEQSVLGAMMLSKDAIADVVEVVRPGDFYRPAHQLIYDSILDLYGRGEPADAVTVSAELTRIGQLVRSGGAPYLHTLISLVPTAANAGYYAQIVAERATLRRLVVAGTRIVQMGYETASGSASEITGSVDDVVDRAQAEVYEVTERRTSEDYVHIETLLQPTLDEIDKISSTGGIGTGIPTGFAQLDEYTNGLHPGQMVTVAGRPGSGKSTLALDFARSAAVKNGKPAVIFSLEMSKIEIMMRMFSAEATVSLQNMRSGHMSDQDWTRLARRSSELAEAPLFIDDSPNLTMMEIRAKARRLRQRHDLQLVVIDYLQLMTSGKRVESRQQEVSEFSRATKLLAKELDLPVVVLSQLNRGPEQRTDKKPMLADLRESGCLPASTRIWRADNGAEMTIGELFARGERDIPVWAMNERLRLVPRVMTHVFSTGVKPVFRLRLASGRTIEATANHPFYTYDGWRELGDLRVGERLAIARHAPEPRTPTSWSDERIILLAHLLGDGSFVRNQPLRYASVDEANLDAVSNAAASFGVTAVRDEYPAARVTTLRLPAPTRLARGRRNPIVAWLDELGLFNRRSHEKFVPAEVFGLPNDKLAMFLHHLWATDGCVHVGPTNAVRVYYASTSRRLADDVTRLLTRFGITARIKTTHKAGYRDSYHVHIVGCEQQAIFFGQIGCHGSRGEIVKRALPLVEALVPNTNVDTIPPGVWDRVREILAEQKLTHRQFATAMSTKFCGSTMWKHSPNRARLARVAAVLEDAELDMLATNDVFWDEVVAIDPLGEQEVFDATVPGDHNFLADGVVVHNSIEQDSDVVLLVHRPDLYEPETERAGEADLILAKHRNGPTATCAVAFQGRYSRFADMPS
jgi:replicative DNA helicase